MKWQSLIILFVFLQLGYGCHSDDMNDSSKRNDRWAWWVDATSQKGIWIPLSDHPTWKNGSFTKFYFDGKIAAKGKVKNGEYSDTTFWFDRTGNIYAYKVHSIDSTADFYIVDGPIKVFDTDGKIKMEGLIQNHKPRDKWTEYYKTGFPEEIINRVNDTGWISDYYENGKIKDSLFSMGEYYRPVGQWTEDNVRIFSAGIKNCQYDGEVLKFYNDGKLMQKVYYSNGKVNGRCFYYLPSGKIQKEYNFKDSLQEGKNLEYYENGQVQNELFYKNGKLDGEQKGYNEKGNLIGTLYYKDGALVK